MEHLVDENGLALHGAQESEGPKADEDYRGVDVRRRQDRACAARTTQAALERQEVQLFLSCPAGRPQHEVEPAAVDALEIGEHGLALRPTETFARSEARRLHVGGLVLECVPGSRRRSDERHGETADRQRSPRPLRRAGSAHRSLLCLPSNLEERGARKSFALAALSLKPRVARVRARFGAFVLDEATREVRSGGRPVPISPKAFELLAVLFQARPRALSKAELRDRLWPDTVVGETSFPRVVGEIRRALGDRPEQASFVRTVQRFGYAFVGDVVVEGEGVGPDRAIGAATRGCSLLWGERIVPLAAGPNLVGRDPDCAVAIPSGLVSRQHARLVVDGERAVLHQSREQERHAGRRPEGRREHGAHGRRRDPDRPGPAGLLRPGSGLDPDSALAR